MRRAILVLMALAVSAVGAGGGTAADGVGGERGTRPANARRSTSEAAYHYLEMVRAALVADENRMASVQVAIDRVVTSVRKECPSIGAGAPVGRTIWRVGVGIAEVLAVAAANADAPIALRLLKRSKTVRWGNRSVSRLIAARVGAVSRQAQLTAPRLCNVLRAWALSRFQRMPQRLTEFSHEFEAASESGSLVPGIVERYVGGRKARRIREIRQREMTVASQIRRRIIDGRTQIFRAVGLLPVNESVRAAEAVRDLATATGRQRGRSPQPVRKNETCPVQSQSRESHQGRPANPRRFPRRLPLHLGPGSSRCGGRDSTLLRSADRRCRYGQGAGLPRPGARGWAQASCRVPPRQGGSARKLDDLASCRLPDRPPIGCREAER